MTAVHTMSRELERLQQMTKQNKNESVKDQYCHRSVNMITNT